MDKSNKPMARSYVPISEDIKNPSFIPRTTLEKDGLSLLDIKGAGTRIIN